MSDGRPSACRPRRRRKQLPRRDYVVSFEGRSVTIRTESAIRARRLGAADLCAPKEKVLVRRAGKEGAPCQP